MDTPEIQNLNIPPKQGGNAGSIISIIIIVIILVVGGIYFWQMKLENERQAEAAKQAQDITYEQLAEELGASTEVDLDAELQGLDEELN